jgi:hypothetical protein
LQFDALKFEIENMRSHASIQGYVITEFTDLHWECNGLLDMYRNPKVYHSRLKEINADDLLIPLWERLAFSEGEMCAMKILFSHYATLEIEDSILEWDILGDQLPASSGWLPAGQPSPHGVTELGVVSFDAPQVDRPTKARLQLRLRSGENVITTAEQEFYIFPANSALSATQTKRPVYTQEFQSTLEQLGYARADKLSDADFAVVTTLDDACREFLLRGGRVLFLAESEDALQTNIPGLEIKSRRGTPWQGDWASSFSWHCLENLPTDHVVNFAFADLTPDHVILGFPPREFALDVYAGLFVGWVHKPVPTIARRRVGQGTLLISTFRLSKHLDTNPLAKYLFTELMMLVTNT